MEHGMDVNIIHGFALIMFAAKIFKVNDLSWWWVFSPYIVGIVILFFMYIGMRLNRKAQNKKTMDDLIKGKK